MITIGIKILTYILLITIAIYIGYSLIKFLWKIVNFIGGFLKTVIFIFLLLIGSIYYKSNELADIYNERNNTNITYDDILILNDTMIPDNDKLGKIVSKSILEINGKVNNLKTDTNFNNDINNSKDFLKSIWVSFIDVFDYDTINKNENKHTQYEK